MFKILVIDDDIVNNRKIAEFFKNKSQFHLSVVSSTEKAIELIAPNSKGSAPVADPLPAPLGPQLVFVDISKIVGTPLKWHADFREALKMGGNENVPVILLSLLSDAIVIRNFLAPGVHDVFVKPIVSTILDSTLNYFLSGGKAQPRDMKAIKGIVEMFYQAEAKEISEFDMKIATAKQVLLNDFKPIYGDFFKWSPNRRVIGRCTDCKKDEDTKDAFIQTFSFVGVPPVITKEIRIWLRNYYIAQKQKGQ